MLHKPLLSVCMITYNHELFIRKAIDGVLMQNCNFEIELIISDDCSPCNTQSIVNEIINENPRANIINYTRHDKNMGMIKNSFWALEKCNGKYIALCEGDDYWTDPFKLQKQVDFLEKNNSFSFCFHNVEYLENNISTYNRDIELKTNYYNKHNFFELQIPTLSVVYRNILDYNKISGIHNIPHLDIFLTSILAQKGDFFNLNFNGGVRRVNDNGAFSGKTLSEQYKSIYITRKYMLESEFYDDEFKGLIKENILVKKRKILRRAIKKSSPIQFLKVLFAF